MREFINNHFLQVTMSQEIRGIYKALVNGVLSFNSDGAGIVTYYERETFFLAEFEHTLRLMKANKTSPEQIEKMFAAIHEIYQRTPSEPMPILYERAAPVYAVALLANGYNLPRSKLVTIAANEALAKPQQGAEKITIIDIACGVGLQGQRLAQILENKEARGRISIIGIDASNESVQLAKQRQTRSRAAVYDEVYTCRAEALPEFPQLAGRQFDVMLSLGALGSYIPHEYFSKMLTHPGFTHETTYCFSVLVMPNKFSDALNLTKDKLSIVTQASYDRPISNEDGVLLRNTNLIAANCRVQSLEAGRIQR